MSNSVINKEDLTNLFKEYFEDNAIMLLLISLMVKVSHHVIQ